MGELTHAERIAEVARRHNMSPRMLLDEGSGSAWTTAVSEIEGILEEVHEAGHLRQIEVAEILWYLNNMYTPPT